MDGDWILLQAWMEAVGMKTREELAREYAEVTGGPLHLRIFKEEAYVDGFNVGFKRAVEMLKSPECSEENEAGFTSGWNLALWLEEKKSP